ncbi:Actin-binding protein F [Balamuthia mandrillaris]
MMWFSSHTTPTRAAKKREKSEGGGTMPKIKAHRSYSMPYPQDKMRSRSGSGSSGSNSGSNHETVSPPPMGEESSLTALGRTANIIKRRSRRGTATGEMRCSKGSQKDSDQLQRPQKHARIERATQSSDRVRTLPPKPVSSSPAASSPSVMVSVHKKKKEPKQRPQTKATKLKKKERRASTPRVRLVHDDEELDYRKWLTSTLSCQDLIPPWKGAGGVKNKLKNRTNRFQTEEKKEQQHMADRYQHPLVEFLRSWHLASFQGVCCILLLTLMALFLRTVLLRWHTSSPSFVDTATIAATELLSLLYSAPSSPLINSTSSTNYYLPSTCSCIQQHVERQEPDDEHLWFVPTPLFIFEMHMLLGFLAAWIGRRTAFEDDKQEDVAKENTKSEERKKQNKKKKKKMSNTPAPADLSMALTEALLQKQIERQWKKKVRKLEKRVAALELELSWRELTSRVGAPSAPIQESSGSKDGRAVLEEKARLPLSRSWDNVSKSAKNSPLETNDRLTREKCVPSPQNATKEDREKKKEERSKEKRENKERRKEEKQREKEEKGKRKEEKQREKEDKQREKGEKEKRKDKEKKNKDKEAKEKEKEKDLEKRRTRSSTDRDAAKKVKIFSIRAQRSASVGEREIMLLREERAKEAQLDEVIKKEWG